MAIITSIGMAKAANTTNSGDSNDTAPPMMPVITANTSTLPARLTVPSVTQARAPQITPSIAVATIRKGMNFCAPRTLIRPASRLRASTARNKLVAITAAAHVVKAQWFASLLRVNSSSSATGTMGMADTSMLR